MQDFKVLNSSGDVIGYVVNSKDESEAKKMAEQQEDYAGVAACESLNVPAMFSNCLMSVDFCSEAQRFAHDKNKHTPGEWILSKKSGTNDFCRIKDAEGSVIADFYWLGEGRDQSEAEANAKLCSASKDLLEALNELVKSNPHREGYHEKKLKAIAAIKKATK